MLQFEGFKAFNFDEGVPYASFTSHGVTFNKSVTMKLDYPEYVLLLINPNTQQIALQVCEKETPNATAYYRKKKNEILSVRWNGKDLLNTIEGITGWKLTQESYRVEGILYPEERAMIFDLTKATALN